MTRSHYGQHPTCFGCKLSSISFAPSAMPTRHPEAARVVAKDAAWDKDIPAYIRLRKSGVTPPRIDGSADLETRAATKAEVKMGQALDPKIAPRVTRTLKDLGRI